MRSLTIVLGLLLVLYCGADVVRQTRHADDLRTEAQLCRFQLCYEPVLDQAASKALWETDPPMVEQAVTGFSLALKRDSHYPFNWVNLGDALAAADRKQDAEYCFRRALQLAPNWPPILMRAANFDFQSGNPQAGLLLASQILNQVDKYDSDIFEQYTEETINVSDVLRFGLPQNQRPALAFLSYLIRNGKLDDAQLLWRWMLTRNFADAHGASEYVSFLLAKRQAGDAATAWKDYLGPRAGGYGESDYVFNGGFETESSGSQLDWRVEPTDGVEVARDNVKPDAGQWSLRVRFDGKHNVTDTGVRQTVVLRRGSYRFRARIRTEGLTTDKGIRFRIAPVGRGQSAEQNRNDWLGTNSWSTVEIPFSVSVDEAVYVIQFVREPSLKFDSLIAGTLWIDEVRIKHAQN